MTITIDSPKVRQGGPLGREGDRPSSFELDFSVDSDLVVVDLVRSDLTKRADREIDIDDPLVTQVDLVSGAVSRAPGSLGGVLLSSAASVSMSASVSADVASGIAGAPRRQRGAYGESVHLAPMDHRIARRREAVSRRTSSTATRRRMIVLVAGGALVTGVALIFASPWFAVKRIEVRAVPAGHEQTMAQTAASERTADQVQSVLAGLKGRKLARINLRRVVDMLEARPEIASVDVRKAWPDRLAVDVVARVPLAIIDVAGAPSRVVDVGGVELPAAEASVALPRVRLESSLGDETTEAQERTIEALRILESLDPSTRSLVTRLDHYGREFVLRLGKTSVVFGRPEKLVEKAAVLEGLRTTDRLQGVVSVDVTVPQAVLVHR